MCRIMQSVLYIVWGPKSRPLANRMMVPGLAIITSIVCAKFQKFRLILITLNHSNMFAWKYAAQSEANMATAECHTFRPRVVVVVSWLRSVGTICRRMTAAADRIVRVPSPPPPHPKRVLCCSTMCWMILKVFAHTHRNRNIQSPVPFVCMGNLFPVVCGRILKELCWEFHRVLNIASISDNVNLLNEAHFKMRL